uniref:V-type proton ATPase subunit a n=1 Tax=Denticeps clupeoides TaxID=299321 RepID=A0AAY4A5E8_9TELE
MGSLFRSEEMCLVQVFLQSGSAYNCVSELGELGLIEFRDLNPNVNAFQRKFVNEVRRCEEMEKTFGELDSSAYFLHPPGPVPLAPQPRELLAIEEESERLARELREVCVCVCVCVHMRAKSVFVAGVIPPWKAPAFERLLWRACCGYIIVDFREMEETMELSDSGELVQWTVFLISFWGEQVGQKVKKICDWYNLKASVFHTHTFAYPESAEEREGIMHGLQRRIMDITTVLSQTERYLQQLLVRSVALLPKWRVQVLKCKAMQMVLNLCSPSVTDKCLIAEAWCPVQKLQLLQSALIEGTRKSGSGVNSFYNLLQPPCSPPTLFNTNSFTAGFQGIVDTYGVARYQEVNPAVYTIITFPFLFAIMFGDVGHGFLVTLAALWMVWKERDPTMRNSSSEIWKMLFGGRYVILLMGLFSIYTGAVYNECFSKGLSPFSSSWHLKPMIHHYNWSEDVLRMNRYLSLDPNVTGVFQGPYPFGIDPIWQLANNHLTFLNSYKMKMSVIIGVIHMTFGMCLSLFNYTHFGDMSSVFLVLLPEVVFMLSLFGYLVFMVLYKWIVFGPQHSDHAPSILIHFIDMFLFAQNKANPPLYSGQMIVQKVLVVLALSSVPVLLLGKPLYLYFRQRKGLRRTLVSVSACVWHRFDIAEALVHQVIHTIEFCLGCISNTASYLRLWALSLAHTQLSEVLWVMMLRFSLSLEGFMGSVVIALIFSIFAMLTVSVLLIMEGLSAFLHALRLHWVEFQNKFYSGTGYQFNPFSFDSINSV